MTLVELARLVHEMRAAQKRYFSGDRSSEALRHSRDWERRVDAAVAAVLDDRPRLFGEES